MVAAVKENKIHTWELQKKEGGEKEEGKEMGRDQGVATESIRDTGPATGNFPMAPTIHLSLNSLRMVVADGVSFLQHLLGSLCASLEDEESDICDADF